MSKIDNGKYLRRMEQFFYHGLSLKSAQMTLVQKVRTKIVYEAYNRWLQDKQINPHDLCRRIAQREYAILLSAARDGRESDLYGCPALQVVEAVGIVEGKLRTPVEISNDVLALNHIINYLSVDQASIYKMKALDGADFLVREGKKMGNMSAVNQGITHMRELFNNFDEKQTAAEQMPDTNIRITFDVGVVKPDKVNYTEEEKAAFRKKYGITQREYAEFEEISDPEWEIEEYQAEQDPIIDPIAMPQI